MNETLLHTILSEKKLLAPRETERVGTHWEWLIAIGKDHTARITMSDEAYRELIKNVSYRE